MSTISPILPRPIPTLHLSPKHHQVLGLLNLPTIHLLVLGLQGRVQSNISLAPHNLTHQLPVIYYISTHQHNLTYSHQVTGPHNTMPSLPHIPRPRLRLQIDTPALPHVTTPSPSTSEQPTSLTSQHKLNHKSSQATAQPNLKHQVQV